MLVENMDGSIKGTRCYGEKTYQHNYSITKTAPEKTLIQTFNDSIKIAKDKSINSYLSESSFNA